MPYFKVKEESGTKKLVDYSMPPVLDASEVGYGSSNVSDELDRINSNLTALDSGKLLYKEVSTTASTNPFSAFRVLVGNNSINKTGVYRMSTAGADYLCLVFYLTSTYISAEMISYVDANVYRTSCQNGTWTDGLITSAIQ